MMDKTSINRLMFRWAAETKANNGYQGQKQNKRRKFSIEIRWPSSSMNKTTSCLTITTWILLSFRKVKAQSVEMSS